MAKKKVRKINWQKIFCFVSFVFILVCCLWYGGRFFYYYLDNKKTDKETVSNFSSELINANSNSDNFKSINDSYYFRGNVSDNYVRYSNILWRIVKIDKNDKVYLISDETITSLAYGVDIDEYDESYVNKWLNNSDDNYSGILENNLNKVSNYLTKYKVCIDEFDEASSVSCNKEFSNDYVGLLSVIDYVNTGGKDSFINNGEYTYLSNMTKDNEVWYINSEGMLDKSDGSDLYGVKPVISLNSEVNSNGGDGSKDNPYIIDKEESLFGSYVKLGEDIWRVYEVDNKVIKLMLNDYLIVDEEKLSYLYSNNNYYHNDTVYGSLAYYLNHNFLFSLSYNDSIISNYYSNGYYDTDYNYSKILGTTIDTKVSVISVGNVIFNNNLDNIWTNTGIDEDGSKVYTIEKSANFSSKSVNGNSYVVPCISIEKDILTKGKGTIDSPYEME